MATHIVLLRAINVGGHNKVPMADLREALTNAGFTGVATYIQSGNIVCGSRKGQAGVARDIKKIIKDQMGHDVEVIVRSPEELAELAAGFPWQTPQPKASGIVFLAGPPTSEVDASTFAPDECTVVGNNVYVNYAVSFSESKLTPAWIEKTTGQAGTRRNWNTVVKLLDMSGQNDK